LLHIFCKENSSVNKKYALHLKIEKLLNVVPGLDRVILPHAGVENLPPNETEHMVA
jgi:hypothetical protein